MNSAAESPPAGPAGTNPVAVETPPQWKPSSTDRWTNSRWLTLIALVFAAQAALIFTFGEHKQKPPRGVANVPSLQLADNSSELLALNDPTLFALPHQKDFTSILRVRTSAAEQPSFRRPKPPRLLSLSAEQLGTVFGEFMRTNRFAGLELQLKPPLKLSASRLPVETMLAPTSTLQIQDGLAQRLLAPLSLPSWPYADVLAPSVVQVVVDAAGNVISTVLLPSDYPPGTTGHFDDADRRALELARAARFAPAPGLTIGRLVFNWHTVPPPATNAPANP
jgi:hypothetical protein